MRFPVPNKTLRRQVKALLHSFFDEGDDAELAEAMQLIADFYAVRVPTITWRRRIEGGLTAARTNIDGTIELLRPRFWHLQSACKPTPEEWAETVLHEWWHVLTWVDEEKKADAFARRWMEED